MSHRNFKLRHLAVIAASLSLGSAVHAAQINLTITAENLTPTNSISFAPLHFGIHNGSFDAFNIGQVATAPIISVAEGGSGVAWQAAFAAADPGATRGTIGMPLFPGMTRSLTVMVDTAINPFFTFAAMAIPSNDFFIGNDSPTRFSLFNPDGSLRITSINQKASQIWDAGSEVFDPAAAAFVGNNDLRTAQNSVVAFNFGEFYGFNGLTTAAGYTFNSALTADTDVYRISFSAAPIPEPEVYALMLSGIMLIGAIARRRRGKA
ncbi:MAG: spondin domain-containing protein [Propionivibrio sp.]|uniref:Spondin domain-containing protein n=1 Tax=Candidatus Propionivibrio dominans TaxID=2954373 RepID=A0A9D7F861_9RHOO|nr:spondin domain-containing protein [Candidatus Propionivibrio dominans]